MAETVTSYHPTVGRTSLRIEGLIQGTACFPGGTGLWRGKRNRGPLPEYFPETSVMFVGHNFDSERGYAISQERGGEAAGGEFWTRLLRMLDAAHCQPDACFFSNALMGIKPGKAEGDMPSVPGYKEQCQCFLKRQVEIVRPCAVVALGVQATRYVSQLDIRHITILHPGNWCLRPLATRDDLLVGEGSNLCAFLDSLDDRPLAVATPEVRPAGVQREEHRAAAVLEKKLMTRKTINYLTRTDAWGFRLGSRNSFLMQAVEQGGKSKEEIRLEFQNKFPGSAGKNTFGVFFTDVIRPFGSASVSRCIRIESDERGRLHLDPERARVVKAVVAAGILAEVNALEGKCPNKNPQALDAIVEKFHAPRK
jgi:hypothetical protein